MRRCILLLLLAGATLLFFNCTEQEKGEVPEKHVQVSGTSAEWQPEVRLLNENVLDSLLENRHGKKLLLNVWATWCVPCREEFPDLNRIAESYMNKGVEVVGISADYPDEITTKIVPFLEKQKVKFAIFVQDFDRQEDLINKLNPEWSGALPATFIYDTQGTQQAFLLGKQSYADFQAAIKRSSTLPGGLQAN
jgi:thiol-disulfide isomerase/thioredoxin